MCVCIYSGRLRPAVRAVSKKQLIDSGVLIRSIFEIISDHQKPEGIYSADRYDL